MIGMTRPGGYAEAVALPEQCLVYVDEQMDPVTAALTEPAATGVSTLTLRRSMHCVENPQLVKDSRVS